jgi:hypothetical protein
MSQVPCTFLRLVGGNNVDLNLTLSLLIYVQVFHLCSTWWIKSLFTKNIDPNIYVMKVLNEENAVCCLVAKT